jgi:hypothetical protein
MRSLILALLLCLCAAQAHADRVVVRSTANVSLVPVQNLANEMARTGVLLHCSLAGRREGVGFSSVSAEDAEKNCCFYGKYRIREKAVARGPRGWFAVIRYQ